MNARLHEFNCNGSKANDSIHKKAGVWMYGYQFIAAGWTEKKVQKRLPDAGMLHTNGDGGQYVGCVTAIKKRPLRLVKARREGEA